MEYNPADWKKPLVCDFCTAEHRNVSWRYPIDVGKLVPFMRMKVGESMMTCQACHELIDVGRYEELIDRAVETFEQNSPRFRALVENAGEHIVDETRMKIQRRFSTLIESFADAHGEPLAI